MQETQKIRMKTVISAILISLLAMLSAACAAGTASNNAEQIHTASGEVFAMDTYMKITCSGKRSEEALEAAIAEIQRLDALLSVSGEESDINAVNTFGKAKISEDTAHIIEKALEISRATNGAFDISIYPIMRLWGFTDSEYRVPQREELESELEHVGFEKPIFTQDSLELGDAHGIDLGGIAKGFTSDRLMEVFDSYGMVSGCVSLGGNVQCYKRKTDGSLFRCGIAHPMYPDSSVYLGVVEVEDRAVVTSGAYERFFIDESSSKRYHHIIDPKTGYPAESGLSSTTIVSKSGMLADALSTACYVMGLEGSIEYWKEYGEDFDMILMTDDGDIYVTAPLAQSFTSSFHVNIIGE